jgi:hypothetical protein
MLRDSRALRLGQLKAAPGYPAVSAETAEQKIMNRLTIRSEH